MSKPSPSTTPAAARGRALNVHCARKFQEAWRKILNSGGTSNRPGRVSSLDPEMLRQELLLLDDMLYWFHEAFCSPSTFDRVSEFSSRSDTSQPEIFQLISYLSTHLIDIANSQSVKLGNHVLGILEDMSSAQPQHTLTRAMVALTTLLTPDANRKSQIIGMAAATVTSAAVSTFALVRKLLHVSNTESSQATAEKRQELGALQMSCCNKFMEFLQNVCRLESCLDFFLSGSNFTQGVNVALSIECSSIAEYLLCGRALESLSDCLQNAFSQSSDTSETQEIVGNLLDSGIFEVFQSSRMPSLVDASADSELEPINAAASKLLATMAFTLRTLLEELFAHNSSTVTRVHSSGLYSTVISWVELAHDPCCDIADMDMVASLLHILPVLGVDKTKDDSESLGATIIRNPLALDCIRQCFLETKSNSVRSTIVSIIQQFIISHKDNYEHIKTSKTLGAMCQFMEMLPTDIALGTLKIVENCVIIHGCLPMHELSEIVQVLRASTRVEVVTAVCTLCTKFIEVDPVYKRHLHTVGIINVIITMLKHYIAIVNPARLRQRMSMSSYSDQELRPETMQNQGVMGNTAARNAIFGCLISMLQDHADNAAFFRACEGNAVIFALMCNPQMRKDAFRVLRTLISASPVEDAFEDLTITIESIQSSKDNETRLHLIDGLITIVHYNFVLKERLDSAGGFRLCINTMASLNFEDLERLALLQSSIFRLLVTTVSCSTLNRATLKAFCVSQDGCEIKDALMISQPWKLLGWTPTLDGFLCLATESTKSFLVLDNPASCQPDLSVLHGSIVMNAEPIGVAIQLSLDIGETQFLLTLDCMLVLCSAAVNLPRLSSTYIVDTLFHSAGKFVCADNVVGQKIREFLRLVLVFGLSIESSKALLACCNIGSGVPVPSCMLQLLHCVAADVHCFSTSLKQSNVDEVTNYLSSISPDQHQQHQPVAEILFPMLSKSTPILIFPVLGNYNPVSGSASFSVSVWFRLDEWDMKTSGQSFRVVALGFEGDSPFLEVIATPKGIHVLWSGKDTEPRLLLPVQTRKWHHIVVVCNKQRLGATSLLFQIDSISLRCEKVANLTCDARAVTWIAFGGGIGVNSTDAAGLSDILCLDADVVCGPLAHLGPAKMWTYALPPAAISTLYLAGPQHNGLFTSAFSKDMLWSELSPDVVSTSNMPHLVKCAAAVSESSDSSQNFELDSVNFLYPEFDQLLLVVSALGCSDTESSPSSRDQRDTHKMKCRSLVSASDGSYAEGFCCGFLWASVRCSLGYILRPVGGIASLLVLFESAVTVDSVESLLRIMFWTVHGHATITNEFNMLGGPEIISRKLEHDSSVVTKNILNILFAFVGFDRDAGMERGTIVNPTALVSFFLSFNIWRSTSKELQIEAITELSHGLCSNANRMFNFSVLSSVDAFPRLCALVQDPSVLDDAVPHILLILRVWLESKYVTSYAECLRNVCFMFLPSPSNTMSLLASALDQNVESPRLDGDKRGFGVLSSSTRAITVVKTIIDIMLSLLSNRISKLDKLLDHFCGIFGFDFVYYCLQVDTPPVLAINAVSLLFTLLQVKQQNGLTGELQQRVLAKFRESSGFAVLNVLLLAFCNQPEMYVMVLGMALGRPMGNLMAARDAINQKFLAFASENSSSSQILSTEAVVACLKLSLKEGVECKLVIPEALLVAFKLCKRACEVYYAHQGQCVAIKGSSRLMQLPRFHRDDSAGAMVSFALARGTFSFLQAIFLTPQHVDLRSRCLKHDITIAIVDVLLADGNVCLNSSIESHHEVIATDRSQSPSMRNPGSPVMKSLHSADMDDSSDSEHGSHALSADERPRGSAAESDPQFEAVTGKEKKKMFGFLNFGRSRKGSDTAPSSAGMVDDLKRVLSVAASQSSIDTILAVLEKFASLHIVHNKSSEGVSHDFFSQDVASACVKLLNMFVIESVARMQGSQLLASLFDSVPAFVSVFDSNSSSSAASLSMNNPLTSCFHRNLVRSHVYHILSKPKFLEACMMEKSLAFDTLETVVFIVDRIFCGLGESDLVVNFLVEFLTQTSSLPTSKQKEYRAKAFPILNRLLIWILAGGQPNERQMCLRNMQNNRDYIFCADNNDSVFISIVLYTLVVHFIIGAEQGMRALALPVLKYVLGNKAAIVEPLLIEKSESKSLFAGSKVIMDLYKGGFDKLLARDEDFLAWVQDSKNESAIKTHFDDHFSRHFRSFYDDAAKRRQQHTESSQERRDSIRERILWNFRNDLIVTKIHFEDYVQKALEDTTAFLSLTASISMRYQSQRRALATEWEGFSIQILAAGNGSKLQTPEVFQLDTCEGPGRIRRKLVSAAPHMYSVQNFNKLLSGEQMQPRQAAAGLDHWTKLQQALKLTSRVSTLAKKKSSGADEAESDDDSEDEDTGAPDVDPSTVSDVRESSVSGIEPPKTEIAGLASLRSLFEGTQNEPPLPVAYLRGVNSKQALLLLGLHSFSVVVGLTLDASGQVVQTHPTEVAAPLTFTYLELSRVQPQKHLFMDTAVEVFMTTGQTLFVVFKSKLVRKQAIELLRSRAKKHGGLDRSAMSESMYSAARFIKMGKVECRRQWLDYKMSNFDYLMALNTFAGRSFNDLTQYPVFPWVIADWESPTLDLTKPETFRDFSKPMGAQHPDKEAFFKERFENMDENPFHYGTHYSSAGIALNYLIRLEPYTTEAVTFQGGHLDHADRLFSSLPIAWKMASTPLSNQDVREMIPEFYFLPDFLLKPDGLDLGQLQDGTRLGDVTLPPWASGSALKFIAMHRQALESPYVSAHLHEWIDLVFGEKQQGPKAEEAVNVFVHLTYDGKVDIDSISDPVIKASTISQIREFGQTPRQVTKKSHEAKKPIEPRFSLLNSSPNLLCTHYKDTGSCIGDVAYSVERNVAAIGSSERILHSSANSLILKPSSARRFFWGASDGCLRLYEGDIGQRHVAAWQSLHQGRVLVAASSHDGALVATGSADGVIMVWHADHSKQLAPMRLKTSLIGHYAPITALAVSSVWDVVVSSSSNGSVIVWDLNSFSPICVINSLNAAASSISIGDWSAVFAVACESYLTVFDINGRLIADVDLKTNHNTGSISCVKVLDCTEATSRDRVYITGFKDGGIYFWSESWEQEGHKCALACVAVHVEHQSPITALCLHPSGCKLLSSDELGNINEWYKNA